jgi:hypothetical protein
MLAQSRATSSITGIVVESDDRPISGAPFSVQATPLIGLDPSQDVAIGKGLRDLSAGRARWMAHPVSYYRLRVETDNPLLHTVTESDVRNGTVLLAHKAGWVPGFRHGDKPGAHDWSESKGQTVEGLFQMIDGLLHQPANTDRFDVFVIYDSKRGYPRSIWTGRPELIDSNVEQSITLIASPKTPLKAPSKR